MRSEGRAEPVVSLVIPVYNEIECLPNLFREIREAMGGQALSYEIVAVDDGSTDGSGEWLEQEAATDRTVVPVRFRRNAGQTAAFAAGFHAARGDIIVTLDADGQNPPAEIPRLLAAMDDHVDLVAGFRAKRRDTAWRRFQSRFANAVRNRLSNETIRDTGCSLKAFRARHVKAIPLFTGMHRFLPTLCRMAGASVVVEVAVDHRPRQAGTSKYGMWNRAFRALIDLLAVRWMQTRWIRYELRDSAQACVPTPSTGPDTAVSTSVARRLR
ncbi:MAG: glycosyltransferase family 2 protein [Acidobacteria bacterium]|nr:glycosyltransferase family 2 protein [Acidobacteriota bacterium]